MGTILLFVIGVFVILAVAAFVLRYLFRDDPEDVPEEDLEADLEDDEDTPTPEF